jgi:hypothetical protein
MENNTILLAKLAYIDARLSEYEDELGEIPRLIKEKEAVVSKNKLQISETQG